MSVDSTSVEIPINRNISYVTVSSHSTNGSQATQAARISDHSRTGPGAAAKYSRIGPLYETSRRQQPVSGVSARLSERYKVSEPHLARVSAAGGGGGRVQGETLLWIMRFHSKVENMKSTHTCDIETEGNI